MSEKVLPPEKTTKKKTDAAKNGKALRWRWVLFAVIVLVILLLVCSLLMPRIFNLDRLTRYFKYLGVSTADGYGQIRFDSNNTDSYNIFNGRFLVGSEDGLYLYNDEGEQVALVQGSLPYPKICISENMALCYSNESSTLVAMDQKGKTLLETTASGTVLDAELSKDGCVSYASSDNGCKTLVTVMDQQRREIYKWRSFSQYINCCAISEQAQRLAVVGLNQVNSIFCSTLSILRTDTEETPVIAEAELGNQVIFELWFLKRDRLCAIGENSTMFFDTEGNCLQTFDYAGMTLTDFAAGRGGELFLSFDDNRSGNESLVISFHADGSEIARQTYSGEIRSLHANGKYLAILTDQSLSICNEKLVLYKQTQDKTTANKALVRTDGTVLLVSNGQTQLYIP